jgi:uncharacterized membrane protein
MEYLVLKWVHIVSSTLLFGTGLGSAFYKYLSDRGGNLQNIAFTNRNVVLADWIFTTPTIITQPVTGFMLIQQQGYSFTTPWILVSIALFVLAGLCWLPVVVLQIRMRDLAFSALESNQPLNDTYHRYARAWFWLGVPAFIAIIIIFFLMIFKPLF